MKISLTLTDDEGVVHKRTGCPVHLEELSNPNTKKAYGWNLKVIFDEFTKPVIKQKEVVVPVEPSTRP